MIVNVMEKDNDLFRNLEKEIEDENATHFRSASH